MNCENIEEYLKSGFTNDEILALPSELGILHMMLKSNIVQNIKWMH